MPTSALTRLAAVLVLLLAFAAGLAVYRPPAPLGLDAAPPRFSAARALDDVRALARAPHPLGSAEHDRVRDVLLARLRGLGLDAELMPQLGHSEKYRSTAHVDNLLARLPGRANTGAILLTAHYDSVPTGPGAADDLSGVAAILEALRALKTGPALDNDLWVLLSDGEEMGLLGAEAFARHPALKDVALVLNVEARGHRGPAFLFETSAGNAELIRAAAASGAPLVANSLTYEVYKRLPNDTDFSVYKRAGKPGLNFAFIDGLTHYHSRQDRPENLDLGSLQHQGEYLLALSRHFGALDLRRLGHDQDSIYFSLPGGGLAHYGSAAAWTLALLGLLAVAAAQVRGGPRPGELLRGLGRLGLTLVLAFALGQGLWQGLKRLNPPYHWLSNGEAYGTAWLTAALLLGVLGLVGFRHYRREDQAARAAAWLLALLGLAATAWMPGASPLLVLPALGLGLALLLPDRAAWLPARALLLAAGPFLVLPLLLQLRIALSPALFGAIALLAALYCIALAPVLAAAWPARYRPSLGLALAAAGLVGMALVQSRFDAGQAQPDHVMHLEQRPEDKALWLAAGRETDAWTSQFLGTAPAQASLPLPYPWAGETLSAPAPRLGLPAPQVRVLADEIREGRRRLSLELRSMAPILGLLRDEGPAVDLAIEDAYSPPADWQAHFLLGAPPQLWRLSLEFSTGAQPRLRLLQQFYGLPEALVKTPRGAARMTTPLRQADSRFTLDALPIPEAPHE